jgi:flagellar biosynthetic protein FliP
MIHALLLAAGSSVNINLKDGLNKPSDSVLIILAVAVLTVAPAALIMLTGFTRIVVVLGLTRNALGLQTIPPNQVIAGLALFISLFIMQPTLSEMNHQALQPYLHGDINSTQAYRKAEVPLKSWMLKQTDGPELSLMTQAAHENPAKPQDVSLAALIPAFVLSQLKSAFIIGFVIFIPFLIIDLVVSATLMSMGMMMLPPTLVSLPFKILLFVMIDGWTLITHSLLTSFR